MNATYLEQVKKVHSLIKDIKVAMLTTVDGSALRSRPMITHEESNLESGLYFLTKDDAPKVHEITHEEKVNLVYCRSDKNLFVSISGTATISKDKEKIKEIWNPLYAAWFPQGIEDPHLCLIKVTPQCAEYWDSASLIKSSATVFFNKVAGSTLDVGDVGDHDKINFTDTSPI